MRITTSYQYDSYQRDISKAEGRMFDAQMQVQTGKRIHKLSDDATGATRVVRMSGVKSQLNQYGENLNTAKGELGNAELALGDIGDLLKQAYQISVRGANSATTAEQLPALITEVNSLQERLVNLANSQDASGRFIFGGHLTEDKPFSASGGVLTYSGDTGDRKVQTGPGETMVVSVQAGSTLTNLYAELETLKDRLSSGDHATISRESIKDLQTATTTIQVMRGNVGTKLKAVEDLGRTNTRRTDELAEQISDIEEVDLSKAISEYQKAGTVYEAALRMASQGMSLSLMDFMR